MQGFHGSQAGAHQQFQLAVQAGSLRGAWISGVGTGEDRHVGGFQLADGFVGAVATELHRQGEGPPQGGGRGGRQIRLEPWIGGQIRIETGGAHSLQHGQGADDKDMVRRGEFGEIGAGSRPNEEVGQPIGAGLDRIDGLLQRADVHHQELSARVRRDSQSLQSLFAEGRRGLA